MNYLAFDALPRDLPLPGASRTGYAWILAGWLALLGACFAGLAFLTGRDWRQL